MLADSYPIRKAARFTARMIMQAKYYQEEAFKSVQKAKSENMNTPVSSENLTQFLKQKFEQIKKTFEDQSKRR